jgi:hypothetical protein
LSALTKERLADIEKNGVFVLRLGEWSALIAAAKASHGLVTPLKEAREALDYVLGCDLGDTARHKAASTLSRVERALALAEAAQ